MSDPQRIVRATDVLPEDWERRKAFVGFTEEDVHLLRELHPVAEKYVDEVVDGLYGRLLGCEETRAFFEDGEAVERVKDLQRNYFLDLTRGEYGADYLGRRLQIGHAHLRIGLTPRWYIGAYSVYMQLAESHIRSAYAPDEAKAATVFRSLLKLIIADMELAVTTYIDASESVISHQSREILRMSTPIVQIWAGILMVPMIGTLDTMRMHQLTEQLLAKIVESSSPMAILDITGVPVVDTHTARHLLELTTAVRLLGAQVVLTGVRPSIAQTMVQLGIDLSSVVTRASLEVGLRYAIEALDLELAPRRSRLQSQQPRGERTP